MNPFLRHLRNRGVWPAVEAELIRLGAGYTVEAGTKHPIVQIEVAGATRRMPIPSTPRTRGQSVRKAVCQVRRTVARMREAAHG